MLLEGTVMRWSTLHGLRDCEPTQQILGLWGACLKATVKENWIEQEFQGPSLHLSVALNCGKLLRFLPSHDGSDILYFPVFKR